MSKKGLIGVQMSTVAGLIPSLGAYGIMKAIHEVGYNCVEISQFPMTPENVAAFQQACKDFGMTVSSISAAVALSKNGLNVPFFFNRKEVKDHGEGGTFVGYVPQAGEEIVIIEDVITAGTAIRESMEILSHVKDTKVIATFIMVDRKEKGQGEKGAMQEIEEQFGFPVYSVVDVYDIIEYLEEDPANEENVTRIKNYLAVNGAK